MRVIRRRELQMLPRQIIEPAPERGGTIEIRDCGRLRINGMPADTAALLMTRQVIAIHRVADCADSADQLCGNLGRQKILDVEEGALADVFAAQGRQVEGVQSRS